MEAFPNMLFSRQGPKMSQTIQCPLLWKFDFAAFRGLQARRLDSDVELGGSRRATLGTPHRATVGRFFHDQTSDRGYPLGHGAYESRGP